MTGDFLVRDSAQTRGHGAEIPLGLFSRGLPWEFRHFLHRCGLRGVPKIPFGPRASNVAEIMISIADRRKGKLNFGTAASSPTCLSPGRGPSTSCVDRTRR